MAAVAPSHAKSPRPAPSPVTAPAADSTASRVLAGLATARIAYVSGRTVYVDAGRLEGIASGDTLSAWRDGARLGALRVVFAASHRASCDTLAMTALPKAGDTVRFLAHAVAAPDTTQRHAAGRDSIAALAASRSAQRRDGARLRGRAGVRYLLTAMSGVPNSRYSQIAFDVRLDGASGRDGHADASLDVRSRRTARTLSADSTTTEAVSRVYRASVTLRDAAGAHKLTLGRLSSPTLAAISLFDGALAEAQGRTHHIGAFAGAQPEPLRMGLSTDIVEYGLFGELHQAPLAAMRWTAALGAVTSRQAGLSNRDFLFAQAFVSRRGSSGSFTQEIDIHRGWRRTPGKGVLSLTSTFLTVRHDLGEAVTLHGGYDTRRNVRLYRDRLTPETEFDDRARQGASFGVAVSPSAHLRLSGEGRVSTVGGTDAAHSYNAGADFTHLTRANAVLRVRYSTYDAAGYTSRLLTAGVRVDASSRAHLDLSGGTRTTQLATAAATSDPWFSLDADALLSRHWLALASFDRTGGQPAATQQLFTGLSYRF